MSSWTLIPCLVCLRDEFNQVAPNRDKGADGAIGDSNHNSSSDHTPDEDSDILRDHDGDSKNEVHALDIDCTGPWPDGFDFDAQIKALAQREREDYEHPTTKGRLQYIIWRGRIISRSWEWSEWRTHSHDDHYDHAHFSARYDTAAEARTDPWDVYKEDDMDLDDPLFNGAPSSSWTNRYGTSEATVRNAMAYAAYDSHDAEKVANALKTSVAEQGAALAELNAKLDQLIDICTPKPPDPAR